MKLLKQYGQEFPKAWRQIASMRNDRGKALPFWPEWCYCPIAGALAVITKGAWPIDASILPLLDVHPPGVLAALAAWRVTKGIYRFDPTMLEELATMPMEGDLPADIFYQLPEWCVYIETPGMEYLNGPTAGVFVSLEYDPNDHRHELRLVFVNQSLGCLPVPIHLGNWTVREAIDRAFAESARVQHEKGLPILTYMHEAATETVRMITPFINLVLYICSVNADFGEKGRPQHPQRKPKRKGKIQTAIEVQNWEVGVRIGPALKRALGSVRTPSVDSAGEESSFRSRPRAHVRKAHWHHFWTGPRDGERNLIVKWLPPVPVNIPGIDNDGDNQQPAVIHPIKPL